MKNNIYVKDFTSLETELLSIDYLRFNLKSDLCQSEINNLAVYFRRLGFNSYTKERDNNERRTPIYDDKYFEVTFILHTNYYLGTHLEFAAESANRLYSIIKEKKFNWNKLNQYGAFLRRIDTCYDRIPKSTDKISDARFLEVTLVQFKRLFPKNNVEHRKNRKGELTTVGHRTSDKYYRVYLKPVYLKGKCLRFEFEHKHRPTLNLYHRLLETKQIKQFEQHLSFEFWKKTYHLFRYSEEPEKVEWIAHRLRPFHIRNSLHSEITMNMHYISQSSIEKAQKQDLIQLFQLLAYVRSLNDYRTAYLTSKFRKYQFPVREFLNFTNPGRPVHQFQVIKAKDFFNCLKHNIVFEFLSDKSYRMLVTIPEAFATKIQNRWIAQVWVADELFDYLEPFLFTDHFKQKRTTPYEFSVLFEIMQNFNVPHIRKEFDIPRFLDSQTSKLNGTRQKKIKDWFICYIKKLHEEGKIDDQVVFPLFSILHPKHQIKISDLTSEHLIQPFFIFEILEVTFVNDT